MDNFIILVPAKNGNSRYDLEKTKRDLFEQWNENEFIYEKYDDAYEKFSIKYEKDIKELLNKGKSIRKFRIILLKTDKENYFDFICFFDKAKLPYKRMKK